MNDQNRDKLLQDGFSRRSVLGMGSAALAAAAFASLAANAQDKASTQKAEHDHASVANLWNCFARVRN